VKNDSANEIILKDDANAAIQLVRNMQRDMEEYQRTGDKQLLVNAIKDQFLAQRHLTASKTEEIRSKATENLLGRLDKMSDNMLLRVIETLSKVGEKDVEGIFGILPNQRGPMFSLTQNIQNPSGQQSQIPVSSGGPTQNPVQNTSQILEAIEHLSTHFQKTKQLESPKRDIEGDIIDVEINKD
jgi:hypothetical protein